MNTITFILTALFISPIITLLYKNFCEAKAKKAYFLKQQMEAKIHDKAVISLKKDNPFDAESIAI